jgi:hypothetical protein
LIPLGAARIKMDELQRLAPNRVLGPMRAGPYRREAALLSNTHHTPVPRPGVYSDLPERQLAEQVIEQKPERLRAMATAPILRLWDADAYLRAACGRVHLVVVHPSEVIASGSIHMPRVAAGCRRLLLPSSLGQLRVEFDPMRTRSGKPSRSERGSGRARPRRWTSLPRLWTRLLPLPSVTGTAGATAAGLLLPVERA